jgi:UDP-N-acetylmuramate dehydrogenase
MPWFSELKHITERHAPLAPHTTFGIGGRADFLLSPSDGGEFARAYAAARGAGLPVYVLGGGSNLLISDDGVRGVVIRMPNDARDRIEIIGETVTAPTGVPLAALVRDTVLAGLSGLEILAGIPGTVGGAVAMNAGGRYGCIGDKVATVWIMDEIGRVLPKKAADISWGYRTTSLKGPVTAVEFKLERDRADAIERRLQQALAEKQEQQPLGHSSAGCFFKNPAGDVAGRLIEDAGMKGKRRGAACVSERHANFIVNLGGATAADVLALADEVRGQVRERFGTELENEVQCWPEQTA